MGRWVRPLAAAGFAATVWLAGSVYVSWKKNAIVASVATRLGVSVEEARKVVEGADLVKNVQGKTDIWNFVFPVKTLWDWGTGAYDAQKAKESMSDEERAAVDSLGTVRIAAVLLGGVGAAFAVYFTWVDVIAGPTAGQVATAAVASQGVPIAPSPAAAPSPPPPPAVVVTT